MLFNPVRSSEFGEETVDRLNRQKFEADFPMGNLASSDLNTCLNVWLVGFHKAVTPIIPRSLEWLDIAIANDEELGEARNFHRQRLHWAKAIGLWMQTGKNSPEAWEKTRFFCEAAFTIDKDVWSKSHIATYRLDDYMAFCFQAEQYETGIAEFEKYHGAKTISLKRALKPREFAYALCLQKTGHQFDADLLLAAGKKMLSANLEEDWLGRGQFIDAATWLKIVHWHHDPALTPLQTVLKAYDDMPQVPRPSMV